jgi:hypothetical protein
MRPFSDGREGGFSDNAPAAPIVGGDTVTGGGMTFPDFIFFMLAEEDKGSEAALRYWCV